MDLQFQGKRALVDRFLRRYFIVSGDDVPCATPESALGKCCSRRRIEVRMTLQP